MSKTLPVKRSKYASSHSMAAKSRWFVGSSSSKTSGSLTSSLASCSRDRWPPLSLSQSVSHTSLGKPTPVKVASSLWCHSYPPPLSKSWRTVS